MTNLIKEKESIMSNLDKIEQLENVAMLDRMEADYNLFKQTYATWTKLGVVWTKWVWSN